MKYRFLFLIIITGVFLGLIFNYSKIQTTPNLQNSNNHQSITNTQDISNYDISNNTDDTPAEEKPEFVINDKLVVEFNSSFESVSGMNTIIISVINRHNNNLLFQSETTKKDRPLIQYLGKERILLDGHIIINVSENRVIDILSKYLQYNVFDYAVNPKCTKIAFIIKIKDLSICIYDIESQKLSRIKSLPLNEPLSDINLTLDWLDDNILVFDNPINSVPYVAQINISSGKSKILYKNALNPVKFNNSISYIKSTSYLISKSSIPVKTVLELNNTVVEKDGWLRRVNFNNKYLLAYSTHTNPEENPLYNKNYILTKNSSKDIELMGDIYFIYESQDKLSYIYPQKDTLSRSEILLKE